ncbi:ASCH domain-containing protein [Nostoc sp. 'Lobaria pulmonaria (5183) cyanobiont']|uniref:ASCH domain-containing protein n=1 Tax=Nostoc sp. 'Lobaria pulmonaria (5183) cyanobiont' TaxID=1618022 RepID=UPI000CF335F1|nr:ASCH domain-containing protein [Nostoc sp. 'Lobaria pulmonaria (5183) cyanobiont']AVH70088.1 ASCH domain protein [Nostoc sp. 'Lobaria pulmonaria (5183) cyanobiont']
MPSNILLLSIKPKYAEKIFSGKKQVELRRVRSRLNMDDLVLVYVSSPKKALVGSFEVKYITQMEIKKLPKDLNEFWNQVKNIAGISSKEFQSYYDGASVMVGIFVKNIKTLPDPIELTQLREKIPKFRPPQSYRYLKESEFKMFESMMQGITISSSCK